jgi:hypothetical protein
MPWSPHDWISLVALLTGCGALSTSLAVAFRGTWGAASWKAKTDAALAEHAREIERLKGLEERVATKDDIDRALAPLRELLGDVKLATGELRARLDRLFDRRAGE